MTNTRNYKKAIEIAIPQLKIDEGCRLVAYPDPLSGGDPWTIGYGHTGKDVWPGKRITQDEAEDLLAKDTKEACKDASTLPVNFKDLDPVRQAVLINMTFNLGLTKLLKFKRTLEEIRMRNYETAALYMLQSQWAAQVGQRAIRLAKKMKNGV